MYKILVLGGRGMLGHMVAHVLSKQEKLVVKSTSSHKNSNYICFNIEKGIESLKRILEKDGWFDYIINCTGLLIRNINVNDPNSIFRAVQINSLFPHELAKLTKDMGLRVIHISTDAVFEKDAGICFEDSSISGEGEVYGVTKLLGEVISSNFLNLRCSIIGPSPFLHTGLLNWFLSTENGASVNGYTNQMWNGVTTLQYAKLCENLIINNCFKMVRKESSTHHFCPNNSITKYELLKLFKNYFRTDIDVKKSLCKDYSVKRTLGTKYSSIKKIFNYNDTIQNAIEELAIEMSTH